MTIAASVIPVAGSNVAWTHFLKDTVAATGHSPVREADASGLQLSPYAKYIAAIGELQASPKLVQPIETLQNAGLILRHLHFSFIVVGSAKLIFRIMELSRLDSVTTAAKPKGRYALFSGTLEEWKATVHALSSRDADCVEVAQALLEFFSRLGLKYVFQDVPRLT